MTHVRERTGWRLVVHWFGMACLMLAAGLAGYVGWSLWGTGLHTASVPLADAGIYRYTHEHRRITAHEIAWRPSDLLQPTVDNREIVWAGYLFPAELSRAPATALLRCYLEASTQPCSGTRQISRA